MYESPHRIADTLRGLLAASCSSPATVGDSGTGFVERRDGEKEEGGSGGSRVAKSAGEESETKAWADMEHTAGRR